MATDPLQAASYNDVQSLFDLRRAAKANDPTALRETARQFESVFTRMMLESMRKASQGDELFDSNESGFYRDMFDDQLSVELSKGRGLGLAEMLVQQLQRSAAGIAPANPATAGKSGVGSTSEALPTAASHGVPSPVGSAGKSVADVRRSAVTLAQELAPLLNPALATTGLPDVAAPAAIRSPFDAAGELAGPAAFIRRMLPLAEEAGRQLGVSPRTILAHAALETGWGRSMPTGPDGKASFNLFGVKAGARWDGAAVGAKTTEFENDLPVARVERFRAYDSVQAGVQDYVQLLSGSARYAAALGKGNDVGAFATALQKGGYATDPRYAQKLTMVASTVDAILDAGLKGGESKPITSQRKAG